MFGTEINYKMDVQEAVRCLPPYSQANLVICFNGQNQSDLPTYLWYPDQQVD